jgi:protein-tyrosine phosphatase
MVMHLSQVLPRLFVGSCPTCSDDIDHLKADYGVTAILNLQTDNDLDYWDLDWSRLSARCGELGIEVKRIPVRDFDGMDLRKRLPECVQALNGLLLAGHTVYANCNVGAGRSPSVAIAYLHWKQGWNLDDAIEHVTRCRSCSPDIEAIVLAGNDVPTPACVAPGHVPPTCVSQ